MLEWFLIKHLNTRRMKSDLVLQAPNSFEHRWKSVVRTWHRALNLVILDCPLFRPLLLRDSQDWSLSTKLYSNNYPLKGLQQFDCPAAFDEASALQSTKLPLYEQPTASGVSTGGYNRHEPSRFVFNPRVLLAPQMECSPSFIAFACMSLPFF
jgi:hypothetical protein